MKGSAPIKATLGANAGSFGVSLEMEGFCGGSFATLADDVNSEMKGQAAVDRK